MNKGKLYLIPTLLGDEPAGQVLPAGTLDIIQRLDHFIVEEIRTARRFLRKAGVTRPLEEISFEIFNEHSRNEEIGDYLAPALNGHDIGLLSEAGTPCIADPGSEIVERAHELGIRVIPLTGPSSLLLALMASGFNGQNFAFVGYLPVDRSERSRKIREIERTAIEKRQTQLFIETPYRNLQLFEALLRTCRDETSLCIATDITGEKGFVLTKTILDWKKSKPDINKRPSVFLLSGM
jgi:16S rRNA (cytidine1402-2'-O)-methyltransferase